MKFEPTLHCFCFNPNLDPTLTCDFETPKPCNLKSLNTLGFFVFELCSGQTNDKQTKNRRTQTSSYPRRPTLVAWVIIQSTVKEQAQSHRADRSELLNLLTDYKTVTLYSFLKRTTCCLRRLFTINICLSSIMKLSCQQRR